MYVVGGYHTGYCDGGPKYKTIEVFSINDHNYGDDHQTLTHEMKYYHSGGAAIYDNFRDILMIGGGTHDNSTPWHSNSDPDCRRSIEFYDMNKDLTYVHPAKTIKDYGYGAKMFYSDMDKGNNILCMIGKGDYYEDCPQQTVYCEWIDLRENSQKWNLLWEKTPREMFGVDQIDYKSVLHM